MKDLIKNLNEQQKVDPQDPLDAKGKLFHALTAIGRGVDGKHTYLQNMQHQVIVHAIRLAHMMSIPALNIDRYLAASSMLSTSHGALTRHAATHRPKVKMYGIVSGSNLLPLAYLSEIEAQAQIEIQKGLGGNHQTLRLVMVELSSAAVDANLHPLPPVAGSEKPAEQEGAVMELGPKQEVQLTAEAVEESLAKITDNNTKRSKGKKK